MERAGCLLFLLKRFHSNKQKREAESYGSSLPNFMAYAGLIRGAKTDISDMARVAASGSIAV